ncbi:MAG: hypothetical protein ACLUD0_06190 [Eubacterium ramulus]
MRQQSNLLSPARKTAIVEAKHFGGVCLNEGCIPTKTLVRTANLYTEMKEAEKFAIFGVDQSALKVDMKKLQDRKNGVVTTLTTGVQGLLRANKVSIINGHASLCGYTYHRSRRKNLYI